MRFFLCVLALSSGLAAQSTSPPDLNTIGPKVGSVAPAFTGVDQFGQKHTLQSLLNRDGLMLVFYRSADW